MKGDFSKLDFDALASSNAVLLQQGRVQLDSDWNEQALLLQHQRRQLIDDLLGASGAPSGAAGFGVIARGGLGFDGHGQYVHIPGATGLSFPPRASFTIEVFLSARHGGKGGVLVSKLHSDRHGRRGEYLLALSEDGRLLFERTERSVKVEEIDIIEEGPGELVEAEVEVLLIEERLHRVFSASPIPFGHLVHVAVVCRAHRRGSDIELYVDGRLVGHSASRFHGSRVRAPLWFGAEPAANHRPTRGFDGKLFEVRLWRGARTVQELIAGRHRWMHGGETHLIAAWRFDEGGGDVTTPAGSHHLEGILGGPEPAERPTWVDFHFSLTRGRCYVEGLRCENPHELALQAIPGLGNLRPYQLPEGVPHLFFLEVWERLVTAFEDPSLRETALGGPDTAARLRTVWQVRFLPLEEARAWMQPRQFAPMLSARCVPSGSPLENTLYRVEIHHPGQLRASRWSESGAVAVSKIVGAKDHLEVQLEKWHAGSHRWAAGQYVEIAAALSADSTPPLFRIVDLDEPACLLTVALISGDVPATDDLRLRPIATFKWSRDNGATALAISTVEGKTLRLSDPAQSSIAFATGDWIEIVDEDSTLQNLAQPLCQIDTFDSTDPSQCLANLVEPLSFATGTDPARHPFIRRWDHPPFPELESGVALALAGKALELENGVEITFHGVGYLRTGDYWAIPVRAAMENIQWPTDASGRPQPLPPFGDRHRYCSLALVRRDAAQLHLDDLRHIFSPLGTQVATDQIDDHAVTKQKLAAEVWEEVRRMILETMKTR